MLLHQRPLLSLQSEIKTENKKSLKEHVWLFFNVLKYCLQRLALPRMKRTVHKAFHNNLYLLDQNLRRCYILLCMGAFFVHVQQHINDSIFTEESRPRKGIDS